MNVKVKLKQAVSMEKTFHIRDCDVDLHERDWRFECMLDTTCDINVLYKYDYGAWTRVSRILQNTGLIYKIDADRRQLGTFG